MAAETVLEANAALAAGNADEAMAILTGVSSSLSLLFPGLPGRFTTLKAFTS
jgi:hypothetical protein